MELARLINRAFKTPKARTPDVHRKARARARELIAQHGIKLEALSRSIGETQCWNVWPPAGVPDESDPFAGNHYCTNWSEVLEMCQAYAALQVAR